MELSQRYQFAPMHEEYYCEHAGHVKRICQPQNRTLAEEQLKKDARHQTKRH